MLSTFEYDRKRKAAARAIGVTVATLDKAVAEERGRANAQDASLPHWKVLPWPDVVAGDKLLDDLAAVFTRYVILCLFAILRCRSYVDRVEPLAMPVVQGPSP
jgi:hypothetical protein